MANKLITGIATVSIMLMIFVLVLRQAYLYAVIGLILFVIFLFFLFRLGKVKVLQVHEIVEKYVEILKEKYQLQLMKNYTLLWTEELKDSYLIVLKDMMSDGEIRYFPFECNKYDYLFGRGTGSMMFDFAEIKNWLIVNSRKKVNNMIYDIVSERVEAALKDREVGKDVRPNEPRYQTRDE